MSKPATPIVLSDVEQDYLHDFVNKGTHSAHAIKRAHILLHSHAGKPPAQIGERVAVSVATVYNVRRRYRKEGVAAALSERPRSGQPRRLSSEQEAGLTVLACSDAPAGHARWTVRLLRDQAVEIGLVERVGCETIRQFLKKTRSNPG